MFRLSLPENNDKGNTTLQNIINQKGKEVKCLKKETIPLVPLFMRNNFYIKAMDIPGTLIAIADQMSREDKILPTSLKQGTTKLHSLPLSTSRELYT